MQVIKNNIITFFGRIFPEPYKFKPCIGLYLFEDGFSFNLFGLWIRTMINTKTPLEDVCKSWSISYTNKALMFYYGTKYTVMFMPWDLIKISEDVLTCDGTWNKYKPEVNPHFMKLLDRHAFKDDRLMHEAPYFYCKKNGEVQKTLAAFYVSRSFFKWRIFRKSKFGKKKVLHHINVLFKNEIGESVGTYKGGVTQASHEIQHGENPFQTLNRMNRERRF